LEAGKKLIRRDSVRKFLSTVIGFKKWFRFGSETQKLMDQTTQDLKLKSVETLRGALAATYLSYSALRTLFKTNATIWNYLFITKYTVSTLEWSSAYTRKTRASETSFFGFWISTSL
jgi:TorA maturation chaperone TorD